MNIEKIRHLCHAEPFVPFTIHLPDGRSVAVAHPDFIDAKLKARDGKTGV